MAGPREAAALACTSANLRAAASSEEFWRRLCAKNFGLVAPLNTRDRLLHFFMVPHSSRKTICCEDSSFYSASARVHLLIAQSSAPDMYLGPILLSVTHPGTGLIFRLRAHVGK